MSNAHQSPEKPAPPNGLKKHIFLAKVINSGIAAIISTFIVFPLDTTKTRLQNQRNSVDSVQLYTSL